MQHGRDASDGIAAFYTRKRVVIVDDSQTLRGWLRVVLEQDPRLEIVGEAANAEEAREVIKQLNPDVITLDIEMPGMSGLEFLGRIMKLRPMPVVMISGATESNSEATITALSLGAIDCILKPTGQADQKVCRDIARRVFSAACSTVQLAVKKPPAPPALGIGGKAENLPIILIGASTGGVAALETVLADLHADAPPVLIVQHMPGAFLVSFSRMLDSHLPHDVGIARADELLGSGQIRLAPAAGQHTHVQRRGNAWYCQFSPEPAEALHRPSVDALFHSAIRSAEDVIALILTGLGRDGALGIQALHTAGATTIGQDADSSVVYGMPRAAFDLGAIQQQLPLSEIGEATNRAVAAHAIRTGGRR
ncbi:MAG: chemotaxis-specific protein-glutamate methyltransferase CheB [Sulfitobacter sp.]